MRRPATAVLALLASGGALAAGCGRVGYTAHDPGTRDATPARDDMAPDDVAAPDDAPATDLGPVPDRTVPVDAPRDATGDAGVDADVPDTAGPTGCDWITRAPTLRAAVALASVNSTSNDIDPVLSPDGRTLYLSSSRRGNPDIYRATRAALAAPFGTPAAYTELNTSSAETRFETTRDELEAFLTTDRAGGAGGTDIWTAVRASPSASWGAFAPLVPLNSAGDDFDEHITADSLTLWYAPGARDGGAGLQDLWSSRRPTRTGAFPPPTNAAELNTAANDFYPSLTDDQLVIVFASDRAGGVGGADLWYAVRSDAGARFGAPRLVPGVNTSANESDPFVRGDGCELVFVSDRAGGMGGGDLYRAEYGP